jgi:hypothetical protein
VPQEAPSLGRIDELLAFLPAFETPNRTFIKEWACGGTTGHVPYPIYEDDVLEFFRMAGKPWWMDRSYQPRQARLMLEDVGAIPMRSLADVCTMLAYCVRAERFGDGFWEFALQTGYIQALLRRLAVLRDDLAPGLGEGVGEQRGDEQGRAG